MSNFPLVSIIIPTYNRAHLIGKTLESILRQTYHNWECIIVDDGSNDNTMILISKYISNDCRFQFHHRPKDRKPGGNAARNYGFEISKGDFVCWFDSDDLMMSEKIGFQIKELLKSNKKIHLCSGIKYDCDTKQYKALKINFNDSLFRQIALNTTEIMTPSLLIDRETFIASKTLFREDISRGQETYFFINLISTVDSSLILQSGEILFQYNLHSQSISKSDQKYLYKNVKSKAIVFCKIWRLNKYHGDSEIANKMYRKCIKLLFSSLRHKDYEISKLILELIKTRLRNGNSNVYIRVLFCYKLSKTFNKGNYRLMNSLLEMKIKP